ncbi:MAG: MBL fold metallo-hydrolase [Flavobacteriaceae bacterium]|nr:MBL fold metallo-hydrolase [Flavobacteriaceae bacterium]
MKLFLSKIILFSFVVTNFFIGYCQINVPINSPFLKILGTVQDGGLPHIGCQKTCCTNPSLELKQKLKVTALSVTQPKIKSTLLFEATPDIISQWNLLENIPSAIFLTHAHMGHYSGLIHLGREALGAQNIPVYVMPRMNTFLKQNAPWSQLVSLKNIALNEIDVNSKSSIGQLYITPILVPHRDEFSETVGYKIEGPKKTVLFLPDIDKWSLWEMNLSQVLQTVDYAFIDGTFFDESELNYRPIEEIPHPLVKETIALIKTYSKRLRNKVYFIHMNHTNPMLDPESRVSKWVLEQGFNIAREGQIFKL